MPKTISPGECLCPCCWRIASPGWGIGNGRYGCYYNCEWEERILSPLPIPVQVITYRDVIEGFPNSSAQDIAYIRQNFPAIYALSLGLEVITCLAS